MVLSARVIVCYREISVEEWCWCECAVGVDVGW